MPQNLDHHDDSDIERARSFDPERGSFAPPGHPPLRDPQTNPRGVRHIDETAQDHMSAAERPRYRAARGRRARMLATASAAKRRLRGLAARRTAPPPGDPPNPKA